MTLQIVVGIVVSEHLSILTECAISSKGDIFAHFCTCVVIMRVCL